MNQDLLANYLPISSWPRIPLYWISFFAPLRSLRLSRLFPFVSVIRERSTELIVAGVSKATFIALVISQGGRHVGHQAGLVVARRLGVTG
jgi:hypothetical protein